MNDLALIFIPDISGYTEFITQTEIRHSKHIISELLEIIISGNTLSMKVSEIEGDAVLFYRIGDAPSLNEIIEQVKRIFIDFHTHLKVIQRDNVCQCGACRSAINLSLKFIVHYGVLSETVIGNFLKIIGSDVILAHRLLKNNLNVREYLLLTENYWEKSNADENATIEIEAFGDHTEAIANFENIKLKYAELSSLREKIPEPMLSEKNKFYKEKPDAQVEIEAPMMLVHELLTDIDAKLEYVPGIKKVTGSSKINRVNTSHTCVFDDLEIHFVTLSNENRRKEISYTEEADLSIGPGFISDYRMKETHLGTNLEVRIFPKRKTINYKSALKEIINDFKEKIVLMRIKKVNKKNMVIFRDYCERIAKERKSKT